MKTVERLCQDLFSGMLLLGVSACVVVPVPLPIDDAVEARRDSVGQSMASFQSGKTTRREIVLALGEPDAVSIDERTLVYWSPKWRIWVLILVPYDGDAETDRDIDYFVARFDAEGVLVEFKEEEGVPELFPPLTRYAGHKVLFQQKAVRYIKPEKWWGPLYHPGIILLTETELVFILRKPVANEPPELRLTYSSLIKAEIEQVKLTDTYQLCLYCRSGAEHKFRIEGDGNSTQKAYSLIQSKLTP